MTEFGVIGIGPLAGTVVQSLYGLGFSNVMLIGDREIEKVDLPAERLLVFPEDAPKAMIEGEQRAAWDGQKIFSKMEELLGLPDRIFVVAAADGSWGGATMVLVECALGLIKKAGHASAQRVGVFIVIPPMHEIKTGQQAKDVEFLVDHLLNACAKRRQFDPLIVSDRTNICAVLDAIAAPSLADDDVIEEEQDPVQEVPEVASVPTEREFDELYGE